MNMIEQNRKQIMQDALIPYIIDYQSETQLDLSQYLQKCNRTLVTRAVWMMGLNFSARPDVRSGP